MIEIERSSIYPEFFIRLRHINRKYKFARKRINRLNNIFNEIEEIKNRLERILSE